MVGYNTIKSFVYYLFLLKLVVHFALGDSIDKLAKTDQSIAVSIKIIECLFGIQDLFFIVKKEWSDVA